MPDSVFIWGIAAATLGAIFLRPLNWPEAVWACLGAFLFVLSGLLPMAKAAAAVLEGSDVYLFLTGMMLLAELARKAGVFDWLAARAVAAAGGSGRRLFTLIYLVGVAVTVFLSNDATAVVLTPAVYAAVQRAGTKPLPYLFICVFIANAASFVLPISNPANLVLYGKHLPPLLPWLKTFLLPSALSIVATYISLRWIFRRDLKSEAGAVSTPVILSGEGRLAAAGIIATATVLICASALGSDLGLPACTAAIVTVLIAERARVSALKSIAGGVSWSVLPLVAGLFVMVQALERAGAVHDLSSVLHSWSKLPAFAGSLASSFGVAGLSNVMNNLPSGLLSGASLTSAPQPAWIRDAVLIGVDLGPNLSVTGSLATVLWLIVLRREGESVGVWQFFKTGLLVMPPALLLATLALMFRF